MDTQKYLKMSDNNDGAAEMHKLKFTGCCSLSNRELSQLYKLDALTDMELESVGVDRNSLIDDYRHLHEMAQLRELERLPSLATTPKRFVSKLRRPKFKSPRKPTKTFTYDLLNRFFRCMQSESVAFCRFMEKGLKIVTDIQKETKILLMAPNEREFARYESYFEYLDQLYQTGEQDRVISIVAKVMINFHRDPNPVKVLPGFGRGYGPHYARNRTVETKQNPKLQN